MHPVFFGLKRAFHSTLRIGRPILKEVQLTPARFDMLYVLRKRDGLLQLSLQRILGVTRATVSRMLRSLEALRFVRRTIDEGDRRRKRVYLTDLGRETIGAACRLVMRTGFAQRVLDEVLARKQVARWTRGHAFGPPGILDDLLMAMRTGLRDKGCLEYPWRVPISLPAKGATAAGGPSGGP